jgi:hypothetical protein
MGLLIAVKNWLHLRAERKARRNNSTVATVDGGCAVQHGDN